MSMEDMFFTFPRLETQRLVLRQIRASDADALFAFFSDEEVVESSNKRHRLVEESQAFIQQLQQWYQAHENVEWGITRKGDDVLIGTCGFYAFDKGFHRAETGYELLKTCWRQGIMSSSGQRSFHPSIYSTSPSHKQISWFLLPRRNGMPVLTDFGRGK